MVLTKIVNKVPELKSRQWGSGLEKAYVQQVWRLYYAVNNHIWCDQKIRKQNNNCIKPSNLGKGSHNHIGQTIYSPPQFSKWRHITTQANDYLTTKSLCGRVGDTQVPSSGWRKEFFLYYIYIKPKLDAIKTNNNNWFKTFKRFTSGSTSGAVPNSDLKLTIE